MNKSNIAAAINTEHQQVEAAKSAVAQHACECGRLLLEAKETVAHGAWEAWVQKHCSFSMRTAQLYMCIYREISADPAKAQRVADLSLREIDREMASPKPTRTKARRPFTREEMQQLDRLLAHWYSGSPDARIAFAGELYKQGELSADQFQRIAEAQAPFISPERAVKNLVSRFLKHVPSDVLPRLADAIHRAGGKDLAKALRAGMASNG
jgi:Protein of unknown function (DUF3102)